MAEHRHKRETNARRLRPPRVRAVAIAGPLAFLATASAVTLGVVTANPAARDAILTQPSSADAPSSPSATEAEREALGRPEVVSRGQAGRRTPKLEAELPSRAETILSAESTRKAVANADRSLWTTDGLNIWSDPGEKAENLGELEPGKKVMVTDRTLYGRDEIVLNGKSRWVTRGYLTTEKPFTLGGDCTNGTSVPSGVSPNVAAVHAAVCAEFPEISVYGTLRGGGGDHSVGRAVDIMVSGERGWQVAEFVRQYYVELGVSYVIYSQNIWSVERGGEGWRPMEDRGSTTANHYDHVHVSTY